VSWSDAEAADDGSGKHREHLRNPSAAKAPALVLAPFENRLPAADARNWLLGMIAIEFAVILLIVTNASASTVTREKEDGSLDLLLATPITQPVLHLGQVARAGQLRLAAVGDPAAQHRVVRRQRFVGRSPRARGDWVVYPEALLVLPGTLTIVVAFAAILGMQMSLRCRRTVMAVMSSVGIVMGICIGLGLCGYNGGRRRDDGAGRSGVRLVQPVHAGDAADRPAQFAKEQFGFESAGAVEGDPRGTGNGVSSSGGIATGAYTAVVWGMYKSLVTNFDHDDPEAVAVTVRVGSGDLLTEVSKPAAGIIGPRILRVAREGNRCNTSRYGEPPLCCQPRCACAAVSLLLWQRERVPVVRGSHEGRAAAVRRRARKGHPAGKRPPVHSMRLKNLASPVFVRARDVRTSSCSATSSRTGSTSRSGCTTCRPTRR